MRMKQLVFRQLILYTLTDSFVPVTSDWHIELHIFDRLVRSGNRLKFVLLHSVTAFSDAELDMLEINLLCYVNVAYVLGKTIVYPQVENCNLASLVDTIRNSEASLAENLIANKLFLFKFDLSIKNGRSRDRLLWLKYDGFTCTQHALTIFVDDQVGIYRHQLGL